MEYLRLSAILVDIMDLFTIASLCLILLLSLHAILHIRSVRLYWKKRNVPYITGRWLLISEIKLFLLKKSIGDFLWEVYDRFEGKIVGFNLFGTPCVLVKDVDIIKNILIKDFNNFQNRTVGSEHKADALGSRLLFTSKNPEWRFTRVNVSSTFSTGKLRTMYPQINNVADNLVEFIKNHNDNPMDAKETLHKFSTDSITACAFGINANCFVDENAISRVAARKIFEFNTLRGFIFMCYFLLPDLAGRLRMTFINSTASKFVMSMFQDIVKDRQLRSDVRSDFVGKLIQLLNEKKYLKAKEEVYAQAAQFWLAGFETIGSSIMFLLHELSHHQEMQEKLREEIRSVMENKGEISYDTIREMPYLNMCMNESFRKYPILPFLDRICTEEYKVPGTNVTLGANTSVYISVQGLAYDSQHFPDPYKFNPERWSSENKNSIKTFSYLPFGEGPRNCIGARFGKISVAVGIVKVISAFKVCPTAPYEAFKYDSKGFLLNPRKLLKLKFEKLYRE